MQMNLVAMVTMEEITVDSRGVLAEVNKQHASIVSCQAATPVGLKRQLMLCIKGHTS